MAGGYLILPAVFLIPIAAALFPRSSLFSWFWDLSWWSYQHGWSVMPKKWTRDEYESGLRVFVGFIGAFGFVLSAGVWMASLAHATGR
jgi:hypothetical protein